MRKMICILVVWLVAVAPLMAQQVPCLLPRQEDDACREWVDKMLSGMSLKEKVGQTFVYTLSPEWSKKNEKLVRQLAKKYKVGGLLFSGGEADGQARLTNLAQQETEIPLMITFDGEWGLAMRLQDTPLFPKNAALGCITNNSLIEEYGHEVARELRELGVHVNFAPDADVNTNPENPVINIRSFGGDPKAVAERVLAYARGLESGGILSVSKHFPGHGDTDIDSHKALPTVYYNRARLDSIELLPFREVIRAGLGGIMVGHLRVPELEPDRLTAASLSRSVVTDVLKRELGFRGLVFTDALAMKAVSGERDVTAKALRAGNDMVLVGRDIEQALETVMAAIDRGDLSVNEVEAKCRKILTYKYLLGLDQENRISADGLNGRIHTVEAQALASKLRFAGVTVLRNNFSTIPLPADQSTAILCVGREKSDQPFIDRFVQYTSPVECFRITKDMTEEEWYRITNDLKRFRRVVISVTMEKEELAACAPLLNTLDLQVPVTCVFFTSYRAMFPIRTMLERTATVVLAHSSEEDLQRHVADVCFAKAPAGGRLSMRIGHLFAIGEGSDIVPGMKPVVQPEDCGMKGYRLHRVDSLVNAGLAAGAFPGCQVVVMKDGIPVYNRCFGSHSDTDKTAVRPTDLFDLASLTKTTATLLAVMKLYDQGKLKLTDKASAWLPWLRSSNKKNITIRDLLLHESGLLPYIRFYREAIDENTVTGPFTQGFVDEWHHTRIGEYTYACSDFKFKKGLISPKQTPTHTLHMAEGMWLNKAFKSTVLQSIARSEMGQKRYVYSDVGFVVLQQVVEAITKQPMNEFLNKEFYRPMGLERTLFTPLIHYDRSEVMPTAANDYLRRQDLCGYVQDETAACLGGIAGNAGLFSTAGEVAAVYQMLLNDGEWKGHRYLDGATVRLFTTYTSVLSHRGLGFDKPNYRDVKASSCAPGTPARVYGHTGSTGTCVWVDPEERLIYVFLSNRVCPDQWNAKLNNMKIRQNIQQAIYDSLPDTKGLSGDNE